MRLVEPDNVEGEGVGERLREARRAAGVSAKDLGVQAAKYLKRSKPISESAVRNQENGTNGIPYKLLFAYATVLKADVSKLLFGNDYVEPVRSYTADRLVHLTTPISCEWHEPAALEDAIRFHLPGYDPAISLFASPFTGPAAGPYQPADLILTARSEDVPAKPGDHVSVLVYPSEPAEGDWKPSHQILALVVEGAGPINLQDLQTAEKLKFPPGSYGFEIGRTVIGFQRVRPPPEAKITPINR